MVADPVVHPVTASMVDGVYDLLLDAITESRLTAGTALSQNKLAARMGVSRTPVREALLRLERDGLVQRTADGGFVVATITPEEVNEACDLLVLLDGFVYLRAAKVMSGDELDALLVLASSLVQSAQTGDTGAWRLADRSYHAAVMAAADNRYVKESLEQTRRRVQRFWMHEPHFDGRLKICSQDHVTLAQAMVDGDEVVLQDTVRAHIERLRGNVLARLQNAAPLMPGLDPLAGVVRGSGPIADAVQPAGY